MAAAGPAGPGSGPVTHVDVWLSLPALMPQLIGGEKGGAVKKSVF